MKIKHLEQMVKNLSAMGTKQPGNGGGKEIADDDLKPMQHKDIKPPPNSVGR